MAIDSILAQIDAEIARLNQVRALLSGAGKAAPSTAATKTVSAPKRQGRKRRVLSAEARKRIAEAQRKRWAAQRAKAGKAAKAK
jgi:hypothetical protein